MKYVKKIIIFDKISLELEKYDITKEKKKQFEKTRKLSLYENIRRLYRTCTENRI